jgi:large conductance mechanosensitive channel
MLAINCLYAQLTIARIESGGFLDPAARIGANPNIIERDSNMGIMSEFKAFVAKGNVLDLAVGVIIGAAFGKIVTSMTEDLIMPIISKVTGGVSFVDKFMLLGDAPAGKAVSTLAEAKASGVPVFAYGNFITEVLNFLILAFVIFMIIKQANKMMPPPAADAGPSEVDLLTEIRDSLKK